MIKERFALAMERVKQIEGECLGQSYKDYFDFVAKFLIQMEAVYKGVEKEELEDKSLTLLKKCNQEMYADILPEHYNRSYANPDFASAELGKEHGSILCFLYVELRTLIVCAYEQDMEGFLIRVELFLEIYYAFLSAYDETNKAPQIEQIKETIYWFMSDYSETEIEKSITASMNPKNQFAVNIILNSDLTDVKYLYRFGEYVTDIEIETALFINNLPQETIDKMADTFTQGFIMGFVKGQKDLAKKKSVMIRYYLGFERVIKKVISNFSKIGLESLIFRASTTAFTKAGSGRNGYCGAIPNKQYDFDHKEDEALFFDKKYMNRKLEARRAAYEKNKEWAALHAGPAVLITFGEPPFSPNTKENAIRYTTEQQKLAVEYATKAAQMADEFVPGEERSFTIIAFPTPQIGADYHKIFDETIRVNTLDNEAHESIQQTIIDALDETEYVIIKGMNGNRTDLKVALTSIQNREKETLFENCVGDVNIPVGEVFTSPRLKGTVGVIHVPKVYLGGMEYRELEIELTDGMVTNYTCKNFETEEENKKYLRDTIMAYHDTVPIGEFAIGTNTVAYQMMQKYKLQDKLPVLISEKTGPHFALGDTCYSHSEDIATFNADGKEIIARDNEVSILRKTDMSAAYFNCHTDITILYDELELLAGVKPDGTQVSIIENGRFVLEGTTKLNEAFEQ